MYHIATPLIRGVFLWDDLNRMPFYFYGSMNGNLQIVLTDVEWRDMLNV